jgi:hypothetical protein
VVGIEVFICLLWFYVGEAGTAKNLHNFYCVPNVFSMNVSVSALRVL